MTQSIAAHQKKTENTSITSQQVEAYLYNNPAYFENHLELLEQLTLPHPSGKAISLLSRQVELLREKNHRLKNQLNELIDIARSNDDLFRRMHMLTRAIVEAPTLEDTLAELQNVLHNCFLADLVTVKILADRQDSALCNVFISPDHPELEAFKTILEAGLPRCCHPTRRQAEFMFNALASEAKSCAFIPARCGATKLLLAIGSRDPNHFNPTMGHLFLTQIGELLGSRIDALLNRDPRN